MHKKSKRIQTTRQRLETTGNTMNFEEYHKIHRYGHEENQTIFVSPDDEIVIEEKIDGANFRFMAKDERIIFGSHHSSIGDDTQEIGGNFKRSVDFIREKTKGKKLPEGLIFYGESCHRHSIHYDWENMPPYLGFDIKGENGYLNYPEKQKIFEELGLPMVPLLGSFKANEILEKFGTIEEKNIPKSKYYPGQAEGIVIKNYSSQIMAKFVTDKFKEVNRDAFGIAKRYAEDDSEKLVAQYCTNARIDKQIFKLIDEGQELDMPLMRFLPKRVIEDMYEENWKEIVHGNQTIDFKRVRNLINQRSRAVLQQVITNNQLQKKEN